MTADADRRRGVQWVIGLAAIVAFSAFAAPLRQPTQVAVATNSEADLSAFEVDVMEASHNMVEVEVSWTISNLSGPPIALIDMPDAAIAGAGEIHLLEPQVNGAPVRDQTVPAGETASLQATVRIARAAWARGCWTVGYAIPGTFEPVCINRSEAAVN